MCSLIESSSLPTFLLIFISLVYSFLFLVLLLVFLLLALFADLIFFSPFTITYVVILTLSFKAVIFSPYFFSEFFFFLVNFYMALPAFLFFHSALLLYIILRSDIIVILAFEFYSCFSFPSFQPHSHLSLCLFTSLIPILILLFKPFFLLYFTNLFPYGAYFFYFVHWLFLDFLQFFSYFLLFFYSLFLVLLYLNNSLPFLFLRLSFFFFFSFSSMRRLPWREARAMKV